MAHVMSHVTCLIWYGHACVLFAFMTHELWVFEGISFSVRVTISALTVLSLCLIWWYTELERRLLVVRHHLSDSINLFNSPLASGLYVELLCCLIHVPPSVAVLRPEWQLLTFIRLYHIVKVIVILESWNYNIIEIWIIRFPSRMFHLQMLKMVSVYARTPSNEVPQNDRNIENGRFSEIIFDFFTQSKFQGSSGRRRSRRPGSLKPLFRWTGLVVLPF